MSFLPALQKLKPKKNRKPLFSCSFFQYAFLTEKKIHFRFSKYFEKKTPLFCDGVYYGGRRLQATILSEEGSKTDARSEVILN
jgi:hypothetical protein